MTRGNCLDLNDLLDPFSASVCFKVDKTYPFSCRGQFKNMEMSENTMFLNIFPYIVCSVRLGTENMSKTDKVSENILFYDRK